MPPGLKKVEGLGIKKELVMVIPLDRYFDFC